MNYISTQPVKIREEGSKYENHMEGRRKVVRSGFGANV